MPLISRTFILDIRRDEECLVTSRARHAFGGTVVGDGTTSLKSTITAVTMVPAPWSHPRRKDFWAGSSEGVPPLSSPRQSQRPDLDGLSGNHLRGPSFVDHRTPLWPVHRLRRKSRTTTPSEHVEPVSRFSSHHRLDGRASAPVVLFSSSPFPLPHILVSTSRAHRGLNLLLSAFPSAPHAPCHAWRPGSWEHRRTTGLPSLQ